MTHTDGAETARDEARQAVINDPAIPLEDKAAAVFDIAGETFFSAEYTDNERMDEKKARNDSPVASTEEFKDFIDKSIINHSAPFKRIKIGIITDEARKLIKDKFGFNIKYIKIDNYGLLHAMEKAAHNLEPDDLLYAVNVINTSQDITLSGEKHQNNNVLIFKKDIGGEITFLAEVYPKYETFEVFDAWRKKPREHTTAATPKGGPSVNVRNEDPSAINSLSPDTGKKSSPESSGGAARVVDIDPSVIVDGNGKAIDLKNKGELEKWLLSNFGHYESQKQKDGTEKRSFIGDEVTIESDGTIQRFTKSGLISGTKRTRDKNHNEMYGQLDKLLAGAVYDGFETADDRHQGLKGQKNLLCGGADSR